MSGLTEDITKTYVDTNSKTLFLPDGLLESGSNHEVSVEVESEGKIIAKVRNVFLPLLGNSLI